MAQSVKPVDAGVSVGQVLQGKYRVDAILGHGGMGVVAKCNHLALNEAVAIKMLRQDVLTDQDAVSRFVREAQAAVKLKSEYVARVSDVGTFDNGVPYMVMEYLEGHDLGELLEERGVIPVQWAVELMLQTAEALAEAHSLGIVHRDIKPTNLFVTWRPDNTALIKVLDFGISKSPMGTDMHLTQTQSLLGTPAYMSPEQMRSAREVDMRTDIWSLGTVFYEIVEGRRPFQAESFSEMCVKVAVDPPAPMHNAPPPLQQVILRCLAKSPEQRYSSMAEFARDLIPFAADPHGAHMLVERMVRTLRRSQYDWEGNSSTGARRDAVPGAVADIRSGPVRAGTAPSQWGLGSDPAGSPWQTTSDPSLSPWSERSSPAASPWNEKSNPAAAPWHGPTPTPIPGRPTPFPMTPLPGSTMPMRGDPSNPLVQRDPSQPFAQPLSSDSAVAAATVSEPRSKKKRTALVLVLLALVTAASVAFVVMQGGILSSASQTPATTPSDPTSAGPAQPMEPVQPTQAAGPPASDGSGSSVAPTGETGSGGAPADKTLAAPAPATDATGSGDAKPGSTDPGDAKPDPRKTTKTGGKNTAKTIRTGGKTGTKTDKTADKTGDKPGDKPVDKPGDKAGDKPGDKAGGLLEPKRDPAPKCDPFASMHACDKNKN